WLAEDLKLRRPVALKLLNSWLIAGERMARFQREAESIARLEHEGLAVVYEAQMESDPPFIAMRFVEGEDLSTALANPTASTAHFLPVDSPGKLRAALHFFERAARALHTAHEAGVVHRDIKPGNILITHGDRPVITDFGLARDEYSPGEESLTREGEVFGTPAYMSPEQVGGRMDEVDRRTDVWSLGATLFETLCGQAPFQGKNALALARAILEDPVNVPAVCKGGSSLPTDVKVVLQTALERDLERRYANALALAEDLRRIRVFEPIQARPAGPWLRFRRWARREPAWAAALGLLLFTLLAGLIASQFTIDRIQGLLRDKEIALDQERALRYVRQIPELLEDSPSLALAAGLEAVSMHDSWITRSSLYGPLERLTLRARGRLAASYVAWDGCFLEDGERLILTSGAGGIALIRAEDGETIESMVLEGLGESKAPDIRRIIEIPGANAVLIGTGDGRIARLALPDLSIDWQATLSNSPILSLALLPRTHQVVALSANSGASRVDLKDGRVLSTLPVPGQSASKILATPDGAHVITAGDSVRGSSVGPTPRATLWDLERNVPIHEFLHPSALRSAVLHPKGTHLATGTLGGQIYVWDLRDWTQDPLIRRAEGSLDCLAYSPDGGRLAAGGDAGAWVWDGNQPDGRALSGHGERVVDLDFSIDGVE
ncbi:MAG: protein kinase, partial [Planctomycetes bacterium]|nr:protein kinase [Planctomycetota bacterium]